MICRKGKNMRKATVEVLIQKKVQKGFLLKIFLVNVKKNPQSSTDLLTVVRRYLQHCTITKVFH